MEFYYEKRGTQIDRLNDTEKSWNDYDNDDWDDDEMTKATMTPNGGYIEVKQWFT